MPSRAPTLLFRTLFAVLSAAARDHPAPRWLDPVAPFDALPARQNEAGAVMASDGRIVFARIAPDGAVEVRERPAGGPVGPMTTLPPITTDDVSQLRVLMGPDGT